MDKYTDPAPLRGGTELLGELPSLSNSWVGDCKAYKKLRNSIDAIALANNDEGLVFRESSLYHFVRPNSMHISLTGIHDDDMEGAIRLLSSLARR